MADGTPMYLILFLLFCVQSRSSPPDDILHHDAHVYRYRRQDLEDMPADPQRVWDYHQYYSWTKSTGVAASYWQELADDSRHHTLSDSTGGYDEVHADFEFEFYGHTVKRLYLSTAGILSMSPFVEDVPVTHYIAPLYGAFDLTVGDNSDIYFESRAERFIAEWRNVYLHNYTGLGPFHFQVQVNRDGRIVFIYKKFQMPQDFDVTENQFLIGIVGSILIDVAGIKLLVYYDPVQVFPPDIANNTVIIFDPLPTCDRINNYEDCEIARKTIDFDCKWCETARKCTDGLDRHTTTWNTSRCLEEERQNQFLEADLFRIANPRSTTTPSAVGSSDDKLIWKSLQSTERASRPTSSGDDGPPPESNGENGRATANQGATVSSSHVGTIIVVIVAIVIVLALSGWIFYAYKNPTSRSGIWLMEHRPSQWKRLFCADGKWFSRHEEDLGQTEY